MLLVGIYHHQRHYDFEGASKVPRYGSVRVGLRDEYWSKLVGGSFEVFPAHRGE
jgi:hypothetical protein